VNRLGPALVLLVPALAAAAPRTGVIDARPLDAAAAARTNAEAALAARPDVSLVRDPAFLGVTDATRIPPAATSCEATGDEVLLRWLTLAPLDDVRVPVAHLLGKTLACADAAGDRGTALAAARRLTNLGDDGGVGADVWARYPSVDATVDVLRQPLTITSNPPGASALVDLAPAGSATAVAAGRRLVSVASGESVAAVFVDVKENREANVVLVLPPVDARAVDVRARVRAFRRGEPLSAANVGALGQAAGLDVVFVLQGDLALGFAKDGDTWRPLGRAPTGNAPALLALLPAQGPPPEPKSQGTSIWFRLAAAGAAVAAVGLVIAAGGNNPTQRIEVKWP
jgi:hypothetical protein